MSHSKPSLYAYNASAVALGGVIRRGNRTTVVPTVASVCLASAGGQASDCVENYYRDGISFSRAESRVAGYSVARGHFGGRRHYTYSDVFVSNLRIFDRLSIALMQATVTSSRDVDADNPLHELEPDLTRFSLRVIYRGIEIDGHEVMPEVDFDLCHAETYENFLKLMQSRDYLPRFERSGVAGPDAGAAIEGHADPAGNGGEQQVAGDEAAQLIRRNRSPINGPLVTFPGHPRALANRLPIRKFGRARFADVVVKPDRQRLSLLRLNLDSDWQTSPLACDTAEHALVQRLAPIALNTPVPMTSSSDDDGDGEGGDVSGGDSGSNGVPIWTGK